MVLAEAGAVPPCPPDAGAGRNRATFRPGGWGGEAVQTRPPRRKKSFFPPNGHLHRGVESIDLETAIILSFFFDFFCGATFLLFTDAGIFECAFPPAARPLPTAAGGVGLQGLPRPMKCPGPSSVRLATHRRPHSRPGRGGVLAAPGSSWVSVSVSVSHGESKKDQVVVNYP